MAEAVDCEGPARRRRARPGAWLASPWADMPGYREHVGDRRLAQLGLQPLYGTPNPLAFMGPQDVQELSNFFERRVSAYQLGVTGQVAFDDEF